MLYHHKEFFTLAWTTVSMVREGGSARSCSILAAGGKRGMVKLIHPRANLAYGEFRASRRAISVLRFSPSQTSFLFCKYTSRDQELDIPKSW